MHRLILAALLALTGAPALAQGGKGPAAPPVAPPVTTAPPPAAAASLAARAVAALPVDLAGFRRSGEVTDFEARPNGRGLGAAVDYRSPGGPGPVITVYLYDRNRQGLAGDATHPAIEEELRIAGQEIEGVGRSRGYSVTGRRRLRDLRDAAGTPALRCDLYELAYNNGDLTTSYACLAFTAGRFLKLRASHRRDLAGQEPRLEAFARALLAAAGGTAPPAGGGAPPKT